MMKSMWITRAPIDLPFPFIAHLSFRTPPDPLITGPAPSESYDAGQGVTTRVFKLEYLAAIALETGREKDKLRVRMLAERKALDTREFAAIIKRYGLEKRYAEWTK
ncbi:MAG: hypothetical protein ABSG63_06170 [Spirochaetia bacterium]|jgi:hypothetical protein